MCETCIYAAGEAIPEHLEFTPSLEQTMGESPEQVLSDAERATLILPEAAYPRTKPSPDSSTSDLLLVTGAAATAGILRASRRLSDAETTASQAPRRGLSRRAFIGGAAAFALASQLVSTAETASAKPLVIAKPLNISDISGDVLSRIGFHIHSSYSEMTGSMTGQGQLAAANGFNTLIFTEHNTRTEADPVNYPQLILFSTSNVEPNGFKLAQTKSGTLGSGSYIRPTTAVYEPGDTRSTPVSLEVNASASTTSSLGMTVGTSGSVADSAGQTGNILGRSFQVDMLVSNQQGNAYPQLQLGLSEQPKFGGQIAMVYRFNPNVTQKQYSLSTDGRTGTVDVPVTSGGWTSSGKLTPLEDMPNLWPDTTGRGFIGQDNSIYQIQLGAGIGTGGGSVKANFANFKLNREVTGQAAIDARAALVEQVTEQFADILDIGHGYEYSQLNHMNGIGGTPGLLGKADIALGLKGVADFIKSTGALPTYNHPFSVSNGPASPEKTQVAKCQSIAQKLIANHIYGCAAIEIGYDLRGGEDLVHNMMLGEYLAQAGETAAWTAVSDNHNGTDKSWTTGTNRYYTVTLSTDGSFESQMDAVSRGRAFMGQLGTFAGEIAFTVDGNDMGTMAVDPSGAPRGLDIAATNLPAGSIVDVVRGVMDYTTSATKALPKTAVVGSYAAADIANGNYSNSPYVDRNGVSAFYYLRVRNASNTVVAFTNPQWTLLTPPPQGVPLNRVPGAA